MDPSTHTRNLTTQCCALRHDTSNWRVRLKAGKISHVHPNPKIPAAHINSLLLISPILNTLKFSDFCRTESNAMKGRWLNVMVQGHFKIPVSFSALTETLCRCQASNYHPLTIGVPLNYENRSKLFCQLCTLVTDFFSLRLTWFYCSLNSQSIKCFV